MKIKTFVFITFVIPCEIECHDIYTNQDASKTDRAGYVVPPPRPTKIRNAINAIQPPDLIHGIIPEQWHKNIITTHHMKQPTELNHCK